MIFSLGIVENELQQPGLPLWDIVGLVTGGRRKLGASTKKAQGGKNLKKVRL